MTAGRSILVARLGVYAQPAPADPWVTLDGRLNAPGDTGNALYTYFANPSSIATPQANPLAIYHAGGHSDARVFLSSDPNYYQPPWHVAGVDYPVGIRPAFLPLLTPTVGNMPSGASLSGSQITISASNVTLQGFDLSVSGGINVFVNSGSLTNIVISDCYFQATTNTADLIDGNNSQVTLNYCVVDCNGVATNTSTTVNRIWHCNYSIILNSGQDTFNYGAGQPGGLSATQQGCFASFSVVLNGGVNDGHADFYQEGGPVGGGLPWNPNANFVFFWEQGAGAPAAGGPSTQGTQGWMFEPNGGATIIGSVSNCTFKTALTTTSGQPINFWSGIDNSGISGGTVVSPGINIQNNFIDPTGCASSVRFTSVSGPFIQVNLNTNMLTGLQDAAGGFNHFP